MIRQTVTYTNAFDDEVTEDFYFNFTLLELVEQIEVNGLNEKVQLLTKTEDGPTAYKIFKQIVVDAYGVRTPSGGFNKSDAVKEEFLSNLGMGEMIISFLQDEGLGVAFIHGLLPQDKMDAALAKAQAAKANPSPGLHLAQPPAVTPTPISTPGYVAPVAPTDETAAYQDRVKPGTPAGQVGMTTAEKRQYTDEELEAISGVPGGVPQQAQTQAAEVVFTDEEVLGMTPQELTAKGLLMRAYQLKSQA